MKLGTAIECLFDNYVYASDKEWIQDKVAWALYQTWQAADNCQNCKHWWKSEEICLLDDCQYEPKTEPQEWWLTENSLDDFRSGFIHGYAQAKHEYESKTEPKTEPQILKGGKDVHEFCKRCSESKARMIGGERYIICEKASDMVCVSMKVCPLGKWICEEPYIIDLN